MTGATAELAHPGQHRPRPGRNELGVVTLSDRVVTKIATQAVGEVPDAGPPVPRLLGRSVGSDVPGLGQSLLGGAPKVDVDVDLSVASISVSISVRWPASVPAVSAAVRAHVTERLAELTGLRITDVRIHVTDLTTHVAAPPRVR